MYDITEYIQISFSMIEMFVDNKLSKDRQNNYQR